jgi:perosamine synthetase
LRKTLNYGRQSINEDDIQGVIEVLKSDYLTQGPRVKEFEDRFARTVGAEFAVAVSNGTAALHLAVSALNLEKGLSGMTSPITFVASSNALIYNGLQPDFADIDGRTYCIDPLEVERRMKADTGILVPVHFAGQACEMEAIGDIVQKRKRKGQRVLVVEDASHAIGSRYPDGRMVGSCGYSDASTFSFHSVKTIATGEGGMITTNSREIHKRLLRLKNHGITRNPAELINKPAEEASWYYEMQELGYNYRITDLQAALGISQLKRLHSFIARRREIVEAYNRNFSGIDWLTVPVEKPGSFSAYHLYVIRIDFKGIGKTRSEVMAFLRKNGINTQVHYIPVHLQPYYSLNYHFKAGDYPVAESYYEQCLSLPLYTEMTDIDVEHVIGTVKKIRNGH